MQISPLLIAFNNLFYWKITCRCCRDRMLLSRIGEHNLKLDLHKNGFMFCLFCCAEHFLIGSVNVSYWFQEAGRSFCLNKKKQLHAQCECIMARSAGIKKLMFYRLEAFLDISFHRLLNLRFHCANRLHENSFTFPLWIIWTKNEWEA